MIAAETTDQATLRTAYGTFPSGVIAVCALEDDLPVGIAASSFVSVSLDPPLVSVCVQHTSSTWPRLSACARLGLSVLSRGQDRLCRQLAARIEDRFADVDWTATSSGAVLIHNAAAWLECSIYEVVPAGDHDMALLNVEAFQVYPDVAPLVFHASGFHTLAVTGAA